MTLRPCFLLLAVTAGCGPAVQTPGGTDAGGTDSGSTAQPSPPGVPPSPGTTAAPTTTTTPTPPPDGTTNTTTGNATDTSVGDESTTGPMCSCEGTEIDLADVVDEGLSPNEVIEAAAFENVALTWFGVVGEPETTTTAAAMYSGGVVRDEPGGCCGNFLCVPCPEGLTVGARLHVVTADGRLDHAFTGELAGPGVGAIVFESEPVAWEELGGTLATDPLAAEFIEDVVLSIELRNDDDEGWDIRAVRVTGRRPRDEITLGRGLVR